MIRAAAEVANLPIAARRAKIDDELGGIAGFNLRMLSGSSVVRCV